MIESIDAQALEIPFKTAFSHASASRNAMHSLWVEARLRDGSAGFGEGCPRDYVTGETLAGALSFVARHREAWLGEIRGFESLAGWVLNHRAEIDAHPAAWCAV
ncbi:MAG TPA: hypothetical protein VF460_10315, partial [Burkholderiales bacterium]